MFENHKLNLHFQLLIGTQRSNANKHIHMEFPIRRKVTKQVGAEDTQKRMPQIRKLFIGSMGLEYFPTWMVDFMGSM